MGITWGNLPFIVWMPRIFTSRTYKWDLFNTILLQGLYPFSWKLAITLLILKPSKDHSITSSYRPVAPTFVQDKLFQEILSKRLLFLESNIILYLLQYGFSKDRNTFEDITDLNRQIEVLFLFFKFYIIFLHCTIGEKGIRFIFFNFRLPLFVSLLRIAMCQHYPRMPRSRTVYKNR